MIFMEENYIWNDQNPRQIPLLIPKLTKLWIRISKLPNTRWLLKISLGPWKRFFYTLHLNVFGGKWHQLHCFISICVIEAGDFTCGNSYINFILMYNICRTVPSFPSCLCILVLICFPTIFSISVRNRDCSIVKN